MQNLANPDISQIFLAASWNCKKIGWVVDCIATCICEFRQKHCVCVEGLSGVSATAAERTPRRVKATAAGSIEMQQQPQDWTAGHCSHWAQFNCVYIGWLRWWWWWWWWWWQLLFINQRQRWSKCLTAIVLLLYWYCFTLRKGVRFCHIVLPSTPQDQISGNTANMVTELT